jgi:soluble lytic murein transglycosylase
MPPSLDADQAAWRAGWIAYKTGDVAEALAAFRRLQRPDCSRSLQAASLYWSSRAQESHRRPAEAQLLLRTVVERFRNDYYGVRAAARLRIGPAPSARPASSRQAPAAETSAGTDSGPPPDPGRFTGAAREAVETALELESLRLDEDASQAYEFAFRHAPGDTGLNLRLAVLALRRGDRTGALPYLRAAYPELLSMNQATLPRSHKEALYPLGEWNEIARASARRSLDPYLVCALILQESAFNPLAVSRAGAIGLMQVMPETGREVATLTRVKPPRREELFEASTNISLGTAYLSGLLSRYKDRIEPALAAYNAGDGRASRWWAASHGDAEVFVEEIPFTETRLYVKRIVANHRMYRLLYGG